MYKYIFSLICFLSVALGASAQGYRYQNTISGPRGPLANVPVAVCSQPATITSAPCSPLATLYTDSTLTTACNGTNGCSNPLTSDGYGNVLFYAAPGKYTIQYYGPQFSAPIAYQDIVLPCDPSNCSITGGNLTVSSLNKVVYADQQAGATADAKIAACIAALPSGGVCDARGFGATTQSIAAIVTIPSKIILLCNPATDFQPSTGSTDMFRLGPNSRMDGCHIDTTNFPSYSGVAVLLDGNYNADTSAANLILSGTTGAGTAFYLEGTNSSTQSIAFVQFQHIRIDGFSAGFSFFSSGSGWVNANLFSNIVCNGTNACFAFDAASSTSGAGFEGNVVEGLVTEGPYNAVQMTGIGRLSFNSFTGISAQDATTPFSISAGGNNMFSGYWSGTPSDSTGLNRYVSLANNTTTLPLVVANGVAAALTGTGACATNSTQKGGAWAGQATCTGTTGASTFIITPGTTAPNGWSCMASDLTTAANILRQSTVSTTACTVAGTINANDVITFTAVAY